MPVSQWALFKDYRNSSRQQVERVFALLLVVMISLIATSCGTNASAANNNSPQALTLSGSLPGGSVNQTYNAVLSVNGGSNPYQFSLASGSLRRRAYIRSRSW